jgi:predicted Ser/Thr protein kinase
METKRICAGCQKPLAEDAPMGFCPECLLKAGYNTGGESPSGFTPPSIEEIAKLFPQFEVHGFIGKGGMGAVYKARQPALDRFVALKILPPTSADDPGFTERFNREARALARLNHPNIVAVHEFGTTDGLNYLVMEYVDGANLREIVRLGRLAPEKALQIVPQICDALQFAHGEGIVHRDIKPENILLDRKGRVKITDFGIARIVGIQTEAVRLTGAKDLIGTPQYMAPEQFENPQGVDHRADIFSLGVVFYELLTGELPLGRFSPPSRKVQVDVRLDDVVLRALEKEPERRYQQAGEIKTDVETITSAPPLISKARGESPTAKPRGRSTAVMVVVVLGVVLLAFLAVAFLVGGLFYFRAGKVQSVTNARKEEVRRREADTRGVAAAVRPGGLRYQWKPGSSHAYSVKLEATADDYIETVRASVAYTVRAVNGDGATLAYSRHLTPPVRLPKPGKTLPLSFPRSFGSFWSDAPLAMERGLQVDSSGNILSQTGRNNELPHALGALERLVFEPLSPEGKAIWETTGNCTIVETALERLSPMSPFGRTKETILSARETTSYKLGAVTGDLVQIEKHYELRTHETISGAPRVILTGDGTITFDAALGMPRAMEFRGTLSEATENSTHRTPLTLSYKLLDGAEMETALKPSSVKTNQPAELTASEIAALLADVTSRSAARKNVALSRLANAKATEPRSEVVAALIQATKDPEWPTRQRAVQALVVWGDADALPVLIKLLDDSEFSIRGEAIEALGRSKNPAAAEPLARCLTNRTDAARVQRALITLGPEAEDAVLAMFKNADREGKRAACRVLEKVGTRKSISVLNTAARNDEGIVAMLARNAISEIQAREKN